MLSRRHEKALEAYTMSEYETLNRLMRSGGSMNSRWRHLRDMLADMTVDPITDGRTFYRGTILPIECYRESQWTDPGFVSVSTSRHIANGFTNPLADEESMIAAGEGIRVLIQIEGFIGDVRGFHVPHDPLAWKNEDETILAPGLTFHVMQETFARGVTHLAVIVEAGE